VEVSEHLVVSAVFKTVEPEDLGLAGSIPVHLRHQSLCLPNGFLLPSPVAALVRRVKETCNQT
jgi:hypothetical protein